MLICLEKTLIWYFKIKTTKKKEKKKRRKENKKQKKNESSVSKPF
jgi:hypothetical protein